MHHLLTVRNNLSVTHGAPTAVTVINNGILRLNSLSAGIDQGVGGVGIVTARPSIADPDALSGTTIMDFADTGELAAVSTTKGTFTNVAAAGTVLAAFPFRTNWSHNVDVSQLAMDLQPGQSLTMSAEIKTGTLHDGTFTLVFSAEL